MRVSYFKNIKSIIPIKDTSVFKVLQEIKELKHKEQVAKIRLEKDKKKRNNLKQRLPYVTFGGTFKSRSNKTLSKHSGLACLDFDDLEKLEEVREDINNDNYTLSSFVSPSGNGLKVLVKIPNIDNNDDYQDYYVELIKHYSKYFELDQGTKDIARACYLSADEDMYLNPDSELFTDKFHRPLPKQKEIVNIPLTIKI